MHLLYFHGSTLQSFWETGKVRFLTTLNPGAMFDTVHMVNLAPGACQDIERVNDRFRFTSVGLARVGEGLAAKALALMTIVRRFSTVSPPDLVLADDANLLGLTALLIARRVGCPYAICVYYDNDLHYRLTRLPALAFLRSRRLECALERWVFSGAAGVYAGTKGYRDYGLRHGARPHRTYLGNWSVDDIFYSEPPKPQPDGREILFVGRLHPLKFIDDVLAAIARLSSSWCLDIVGEGPDRFRLKAIVTSNGLDTRVRFLGMVPRENVFARMNAARVLVVTQGLSAAVECALSGRPVVAYDHECNAEIIRHQETGLLVPFRDVGALTKAIESILIDPDGALQLGQRARRKMLEECDVAKSIEHRRRFLEGCLQS